MVVILGQPSDLCASLTYQYLRRSGTTVALIDTSHLNTTLRLSWPPEGSTQGGFLLLHDSRVALAALSGVLARVPTVLPCGPEVSAEDRPYITTELNAALLAFLNALPCRVVNRPTPGVARRSVALRVQRSDQIAEAGFKLPALLMTSSYESAARFLERYDQRALVAHPSGRTGWRWIAGEEGAGLLRALLGRGPLYVQELPPGQWLQVTIVGDQVFGATGGIRLLGEKPDMPRLQAVALPSSIQESCRRLARALDLELAQLQLAQNEQGELYCLDISPWPELEQYEAALQEKIIGSLAGLLAWGHPSAA
jgi:hypothetical protein